MVKNQLKLGEQLLAKQLISAADLHAALIEHRVTRERLGTVLVKRGALTQQKLIEELRSLGVESMLDDEVYGSEIPSRLLRATRSMLVAKTDEALLVATLGPEHTTRGLLAPWAGARAIRFVPVNPVKLARYLDRLEAEGPVSWFHDILARAVAEGVSDIHILPKDRSYSMFFRHLGVRQLIQEGSLDEYAHLAARIKDKARMDIAERRTPQDGAFRMDFAGRPVDFRVATVPVLDGEYLTLRVLDPERVGHKLEDLGIADLQSWRKGVNRPDGICLVCGPTGSGKSTTLHATVKEMDRFGQAIFSVEDPVEYMLAYTGQVSVNPTVGLGFEQALRAFMRSDPDVVVLGEIRDIETAKAAVKMAETGHLVLASLHAGSIQGAVRRLMDLGVPSADLAYLLRAVLVQQLVRTQCGACHGAGCSQCRGTGYGGRTVVSECAYFATPEDVHRMMSGRERMPTMLEDARHKAESGVTDMRELARVFRSEFSDIDTVGA